jgi:uncharacterized OB-fold protein
VQSTLLQQAQLSAPEMVPFLAGCNDGILAVPRCRACGRFQWPPRSHCRDCHQSDFEQVPLPATGTVYSWTTTHRAPAPEFTAATPYTVLIVALDGPAAIRMVGRLDSGSAAGEPEIGAPVTGTFREQPDGSRLLLWRPA